MKRPSFQFYPADWLRDTALRTCSCEARGLWMDIICYMHEGNPYGYLKVGNKVILPANLALMVGLNLADVERLLQELEECQVFDRDSNGCIISRRMIRDENLRNTRAAGGKLGGNPNLISKKVKTKVNHKVENEDKQILTPSSSSSSSSSSTPLTPQGGLLEFDMLPKNARRLSTKQQGITKVIGNTETMKRINTWFGRKPDTIWTVEALIAFIDNNPSAAEIDGMEQFYTATETEYNKLYRRKDLVTLLNNWNKELDKARDYARKAFQ